MSDNTDQAIKALRESSIRANKAFKDAQDAMERCRASMEACAAAVLAALMDRQKQSVSEASFSTPSTGAHKTFLRINDVSRITGIPVSTIYFLQKKGDFPKSFKIAPRLAAWDEAEILEWQQAQIEKAKASGT